MPKSFFLVSLGCAKNFVDSEVIAGNLIKEGYTLSPNPGESQVAIVNTCAFLHDARVEALETVKKMVDIKKAPASRLKTIILTGCLTNYYKETALKKIIPEIDLVVPFKYAQLIPLYLRNKKLPPANTWKRTLTKNNRFITGSPHSVYVKIAEGCNNRCSYCLIPFIRGKLRSKPIEDIVFEVKALQKLGAKEINIVAQDTTAYGKDRYGKFMLVPLLQRISLVKGIKWIRLLYAQPDRIKADLIDLIAGEEKICKYLDIPIQHIDPKILRMMGRTATPEKIVALYQMIREKIPSSVLRTTVMVGSPGEGEEEFNNLLAFLERYPFERVGVFRFSPERKTAAYSQRPRVSPHVALQRAQEIMGRQKVQSRLFNRNLLGKKLEVLVDSYDGKKKMLQGRYQGQAPEVDGKVYVPNSAGKPGEFIQVKINGCGDYDLLGERIII
ncbi:MAG: 30S ribosomal protein S12 methylthiotransferase RimO [Firmicutes bacterium]|nr:30S ribosomal protein S12 methylthiotransferase RimO [Bacillota bacterium]